MIWNDVNTTEMLRLKNMGYKTTVIAAKLGCNPKAVWGKLERVRAGNFTHSKIDQTGRKVSVKPKVPKTKYKVFVVRNLSTGVVYKVSGMGEELPDKRLNSVHIGRTLVLYSKRVKNNLEYERLI